MPNPHSLDYLEFYITNVCNLNCTNCNRGNNFHFSGNQRWDDYKDQVIQWSKRLNLKTIGILGGEPFLNVDFIKWVKNISDLWPKAGINIITNGTQLHRWPELYGIMQDSGGRVVIKVSCHNLDHREQLINSIKQFYPNGSKQSINFGDNRQLWRDCYGRIKDSTWPDCDTEEEFVNLPKWIKQECDEIHHLSFEIWQKEIFGVDFIDHNGIEIHFSMADCFNNSTIHYDPLINSVTLHNSDPDKAMEICYFKACHHISKGKLYKCGPTAILPDFVDQFKMDITPEQYELVRSYRPAEAHWTDDQLSQFLENLRKTYSIPQCSLCPEKFSTEKFKATGKKIKLLKI